MRILSNYSLSIIKQVLGNNRELHHSIEAFDVGEQTIEDIDLIYDELNYLLENKPNLLEPVDIEDVIDVIEELKNIE